MLDNDREQLMSVHHQNNTGHVQNLRQRFLSAIKYGEIGKVEERGFIITAKEF